MNHRSTDVPRAKPWSIMCLNATGKNSVALEEMASAGKPARRAARGAVAGKATARAGTSGVAAASRWNCSFACGLYHFQDGRTATQVAKALRQACKHGGGQAQTQAQPLFVERFGEFLARYRQAGGSARSWRARNRSSGAPRRVTSNSRRSAVRRHSAADAAVGPGQAACAKVDSPVPAGDHHHHAIEALVVDRCEDRPPGRAARFGVIGKSIGGAEAIGPAIVRRIRIGDFAQPGKRLLGGVDRESPGRGIGSSLFPA